MVRRRGRRGRELLHLGVRRKAWGITRELQDPGGLAVRRGGTGEGRDGHDGGLPARGPGVHGPERRPDYTFTEAVSLFVDCESQEEVDELWSKLSEGGEEGPCGWLKDRYGLSWQIVPTVLTELQADPDPAKSQAVMRAMLQMGKIDIHGLRRAYEAA